MKLIRKTFCLFLVISMSIVSLLGCSSKDVTCPFTEITWEDGVEEIMALEGESYEEGTSIYSGDCYKYKKEYKGLDGIIQYMFDEEGNLASMKWTYECDSADEASELYQEIEDELTAEYGEGDFDSTFESQVSGNVWYSDKGNIILMYSIVTDYNAVQFSFVSPMHSMEKPSK